MVTDRVVTLEPNNFTINKSSEDSTRVKTAVIWVYVHKRFVALV